MSSCLSLSCADDLLVSLPNLPLCESLNCRNNKLTTLPNLPSCKSLYYDNNNLTMLPYLPSISTDTYDIIAWNIINYQFPIKKHLDTLDKLFKDKLTFLYYTNKDIIYLISLYFPIGYKINKKNTNNEYK